jgi:hypothetical protein
VAAKGSPQFVQLTEAASLNATILVTMLCKAVQDVPVPRNPDFVKALAAVVISHTNQIEIH